MELKTYNTLALILWVALAIIMQGHAIVYWDETIGIIGIAISLVLEIVALWHWWHRNMILGVSVSFLLISGPLLHVALPIINDWNTQSAIQRQVTQQSDILLQDQKMLNRILKTNWAGMMEKQLHRQEEHQEQYNVLIKKLESHIGIDGYFALIMHAVALVIMLFTQVHILQMIRRRITDADNENFTNCNAMQLQFDRKQTNRDLAAEIYNTLNKYRVSMGINWKDIAQKLNLHASILSRIKNIKEGKADKVSEERLKHIQVQMYALIAETL